jgi:hypothetical protein
MKIEWNKVTWYSKWLALGLFVGLPFIGFYYGTQYGETIAVINQTIAAPTSTAVIGTQNPGDAATAYYNNPTEWQTDANNKGFSIAYPIDFSTNDNNTRTLVDDWATNAFGTTGVKAFTLTVPKAFEPQTNFADATLTVGESANSVALKECLTPSMEGPSTFSTTTINGIPFSVFKISDAGAGNLYETTSYRTVHAGECYAVEYTIHSSQIANYPASYNLKSFDETKINSLMQNVIQTFKFQ